MSRPPEIWAFVFANLSLFIISSILTGMCYLAYRQSDGHRSFAIATIGFSLVVVGGLVEPVYILVISTNETLNQLELFLMQGVETIFLALGLGLLFYAITRYSSGPSSTEEEQYSLTDEDRSWLGGD